MPNAKGHKLITCIIPEHKSIALMDKLALEKGIITANKSAARGSSYASDFAWIEMEILEVVVPNEQAEAIFEFLYTHAHINQEHGGMIFQNALTHCSEYRLQTPS